LFISVALDFFATDRIANEQLISGITRLALEASADPELSPKAGNLIDGMLQSLQAGCG